MTARKLRNRITRQQTPEEKVRLTAIRKQLESEKPRLREIGIAAKRAFDAGRDRVN